MESGIISDGQISASSEYDSRFPVGQGRLNNQPSSGREGCWAAASNNVHQWLQVDLFLYSIVTRVATQGRSNSDQWVTKYKLQYGHHRGTFHYYRQQYHNQDKVKKFNPFKFDKVVDILFVCLSVCRFLCFFVFLFACLFVCSHLFVCLFVSRFVRY